MANAPDPPFTYTETALLPVLRELMAREPIFHRHETASTLDDFDRLMAPNYWEVGVSGRRYSRAFILQTLAIHPPVDAAAKDWQIADPQCRQLATDTFLFTYTLHQGERVTRRATLWQRSPIGFQVLYHQGTTVSGGDDNTSPSTNPTAPDNKT